MCKVAGWYKCFGLIADAAMLVNALSTSQWKSLPNPFFS